MNTEHPLDSRTEGSKSPSGHALGVLSEPCQKAGSAFSPELRRTVQSPINLIQTSGDVFLHVGKIVIDHDETIAVGTGEHVHDGHQARFAQGLSLLLMNIHKTVEGGLLTEQHLKRFDQTGSVFSAEDWTVYRGQSGKSEEGVLRGMLAVADEQFELSRHGISVDLAEFKHAVNFILEHAFEELMENVRLDHGLARTLAEAGGLGVSVSVCSASQEGFVSKALKHLKAEHLVHRVKGNAQKKVDKNTYKGDDILEICRDRDVHPYQTVMFGDTPSDAAAAALAGVDIIIICLRGSGRAPKKQAAHALVQGSSDHVVGHPHTHFARELHAFQGRSEYYNELIQREHPVTVIVVEDFSQVRVVGKLPTTQARASFMLANQMN